ncbi:MAG TPA: Gfo/Idh/MocA family oxidoreductase [Phycisphaerae bacterium]|nr:Gfo/Idh/MocA family oxidoreductase [Phycisphaerae bacterium]
MMPVAKEMVRVAIIGIGGYGRRLAKLLLRCAQEGLCSLAAAADARLSELVPECQLLREHGVRLYSDAMEMLQALEGKCEAAYIATGIPSHRELACAAAARGFHVHLEKPPAATIQEVDEMQAAIDKAGVRCVVGFQEMWSPGIRTIKQRISGGRFGKIRAITCCAGWPRDDAYYARNNWAGKLRLAGRWVLDGPATNALSHQMTNVLYLACSDADAYAQPTAIRAELYAAAPIESHDTAAIEIRTDVGVPVHFLVSHCSAEQFGPVIDIEAEHAHAVWGPQGVEIQYADGTQESWADGGEEDFRDAMVRGFLGYLSGGPVADLRCQLADARKMVLVIDGAHESSKRIHRIGKEHFRVVGVATDRRRTIIEGIDDALTKAARQRCLLSDLEAAPDWAVRTEPYDLTGYATFPQRFEV